MGALGANALDHRDNNFDFIRLMAATFVIFYHSFALTGIQRFNTFALLGVSIFFIVSGYFITLSWCRRPSIISFTWNRFLRLAPALALVIAFTIFVIGPLVTEMPLAGYFTDVKTWLYVLNIPLLSPVFLLPGVFVHNIYPLEPNGSIWTLQLEARMYAVVALLGIMGLLVKKMWATLLAGIAALVFLAIFMFGLDLQYLTMAVKLLYLPMHDYELPLLYSIMFLAGSLLYLYRDAIVYRPSILAVVGLLWVLSNTTPYFYLATVLCLPYLVIGLGFSKVPLIKNITKHGDFSYGLYIFAFPIQQTIIHFYPGVGPWYLFGLCMPVTLLLAVLSWNLVESKALKLKNRDPRYLLKKVAQAPLTMVRTIRSR